MEGIRVKSILGRKIYKGFVIGMSMICLFIEEGFCGWYKWWGGI